MAVPANTWVTGNSVTLTTPGTYLVTCKGNFRAATTTGTTERRIQAILRGQNGYSQDLLIEVYIDASNVEARHSYFYIIDTITSENVPVVVTPRIRQNRESSNCQLTITIVKLPVYPGLANE